MKIISLLTLTVLAGVSLLVPACGKSEPATEPDTAATADSPSEPTAATPQTPDITPPASTPVPPPPPATAVTPAPATQAPPATVVDAATTQFDAVLAKTQELVANKQYKAALTNVQQLSNLKLTPEQQKTLDDLKKQITAAMASSGLGGLLGAPKQ